MGSEMCIRDRPLVERRMQALYTAATTNLGGRFAMWLAWRFFIRRKLLDIVSSRIRNALKDFGLW